MKKALFFLLPLMVFSVLVFNFSVFKSNAATLSDFGLKEGDLISAIFSDDPDVYIINEHGYKRLFLNPEIFNFYSHLGGFFNVRLVTQEVRDTFPTSGLFRNCEDNDQRVFGIDVEGEDIGQLHWVNATGDQAVQDDPDFFKKVFCINKKEFNWYKKASEFKSVTEVPKYDRIIETAVISTQERLEAKVETKNIGKVIVCHYPPENTQAYSTLIIDTSALKAHLDHGDTIGACLAPTPSLIPTDSTNSLQATPTIPATPASPSQQTTSSSASTPTTASTSSPQATSVPQSAIPAIPATPAQSANTITPTPAPTTSATPTPIPTADTELPSPPNFSVTAVSSSQVNVSWSVSTDNIGVTSYKVFRNSGEIASVGPSTLQYLDIGLTPTTTYTYSVMAYDAAGNASMMTFLGNKTVTTLSAPTPTASVSFDIFSRNLAVGSRGDDVKRLQALLNNEVNYPANLITGYFGSITQNAVKRLQEKYGVRPMSGYFGTITRQKLQALFFGR